MWGCFSKATALEATARVFYPIKRDEALRDECQRVNIISLQCELHCYYY